MVFNLQESTDYESLYKDLEKKHENVKTASKTLEERNKRLECELKDARDSAELLEFRLLELEQRESRERSPGLVRKMDLESVSGSDSGRSGSLLSLDDILENQSQTDFRVGLQYHAGPMSFSSELSSTELTML